LSSSDSLSNPPPFRYRAASSQATPAIATTMHRNLVTFLAALAASASFQGTLAARHSRVVANAAEGTLAGVAAHRLDAEAPKRQKKGSTTPAPPEPEPPLISHMKVNPGVLAGAVAGRLRANGTAQISAIGAEASYLAATAVILANTYMADEINGKVLAMLPSKHEAGRGKVMANLFEVRAVQNVKVPKAPDAVVASITPVPALAKYLSKSFEENKKKITLSGLRAKSINVALKAAGRAEPKLAVIPTLAEFEDKGKTLTRMMLTCVRAPK